MENVNLLAESNAMQGQLVDWRRQLHMHPETAFEEIETAKLMAENLEELGFTVHTGIARTGVLGILQSGSPGPCVMLRADMDALPVTEENDVSYASRIPGKMHACGHDGHMAIALGTATLLSRHRDAWAGTLKMVFQPAEEGVCGAKVMVDEGVLDNFGPRPDVVLALHLWNEAKLGQAGVAAGPILAGADSWSLTLTGKGGHGAMPHQAQDPITAAAHIITAMQTVVSRNIDPLQTAVISVGSIHGGTVLNVIPSDLKMSGTIRSFEPEVHNRILERLEAVCHNIATALEVEAELKIGSITPPVVNDPAVTQVVRELAGEILGPENVLDGLRSSVSEDMAYFLNEVPGCFILLGSSTPQKAEFFPHHHPRFDIDEAALPLGVALMTGAALRFLQSQR